MKRPFNLSFWKALLSLAMAGAHTGAIVELRVAWPEKGSGRLLFLAFEELQNPSHLLFLVKPQIDSDSFFFDVVFVWSCDS